MKKRMMRALALTTCGIMLLGTTTAMAAPGTAKGYIVFGEDLTKKQQSAILENYFQPEGSADDYEITYCSNEDEHAAFDAYLDKKVIGSKAVSSIMLIPAESGQGIHVEMNNITYCTEEMYQNALISAGVEDVDVHVAAPFEVSGTCALLSAMNAYELMTGQKLDSEAADTAVDELVTTGEIGEAIGDKDDAAELLAVLKQEIAKNKEDLTDDQLESLVDKTADEMDIELDRELKQRLIDLLKKLQNIDLDVNALKQQAGDLFEKVSGLIDKADIDLSSLPEIDKEASMNFLQKLIHGLLKLLGLED